MQIFYISFIFVRALKLFLLSGTMHSESLCVSINVKLMIIAYKKYLMAYLSPRHTPTGWHPQPSASLQSLTQYLTGSAPMHYHELNTGCQAYDQLIIRIYARATLRLYILSI